MTPNGLGLREWALAGMTLLVSDHDASVGATAALVDRAVEVIVVCLMGLPSSWHLARLMAGQKSEGNPSNLPADG